MRRSFGKDGAGGDAYPLTGRYARRRVLREGLQPTVLEAHPDFKEPLREYVKLAEKKANGLHTPHDLATALGWHVRFLETGTMAE